jgi:hypothetical protein
METTFTRVYLTFSYVPKGKRKSVKHSVGVYEGPNITAADLDAMAKDDSAYVRACNGLKMNKAGASKPVLSVYAGCTASEFTDKDGKQVRLIWVPLFPSGSRMVTVSATVTVPGLTDTHAMADKITVSYITGA